MKKLTRYAAIALIVLFSNVAASFACTSFIISGKLTPDGRPMVWKNRDAGVRGNVWQYVPADKAAGTFAYTAIVDEGRKKSKSIWAGTNEKGFSIFNTMSYNVKPDENEKGGPYTNGSFMRLAIERCVTVDDFEKLLQQEMEKGPTGTSTNFGVMDAEGNAAYFEANYHNYFKYDVNDPAVAPEGYLIRSNFSYNGRTIKEGKGHLRYDQAELMVRKAIAQNDVTPEFFLKNLCRSYANPLMKINLLGDEINAPKTQGWAYDTDFITRKTTVNSTIIKGIKKGEKPELITMISIISYPGTTVAMPVWPVTKEYIPRMVRADEEIKAPLSTWGYLLKDKLYCWDRDNNPDNEKKYFNFALLNNAEGTGILQKVFCLENAILPPYKKALDGWYAKGKIDYKELQALNEAADQKVEEFYKTNFGF